MPSIGATQVGATLENGELERTTGQLVALEASPRMTALAAHRNNMGVIEYEAGSVEFRTSRVSRHKD